MANATDCCPSSSSMPPRITQVHEMENPLQTFPASSQLSTQGYNSHSQLQSPTTWNGSPARQNSQPQNPSAEPYSQPMNRYYAGSYMPHQNSDMTHYANPASGSHQAYNAQYPTSRQNPYTNVNHQQGYPSSLKGNYNGPYYGNVSQQAMYSSAEGVNIRQSNYANSSFYPAKAAPCSNSVSHHVASSNNAAPQHAAYSKQQQSSLYPRYAGNYSAYQGDNQMGMPTPVTVSSSPSSSVPMMTQTNGQLSSIPTPPETSGQGDLPNSESTSIEGMADCGKNNLMPRSSFALPGSAGMQNAGSFSSSTAASNSCDSTRSWSNSSVPIQPPPNVDEGSQASSASASSSIPEEQNSVKANSKPNFSYPPTPNTLSSPGAASMSSFHDDLECISSPGWPRTPASPVAPASNSYEFANIKRPESLLKLYSLSDEPDRRYFLDKLIVFNEDRGSPITQCPTISKQPLDVFRVYVAVKERGGFVEVTNAKRWKDIAGAIGVGASSSAAYTLRKQYMKLLLPYECKYDRGGIDPQPIINQVEASSRKKGKNPATGNGGMCMQGYSQSAEGYSPGYQEYYQTSRYPCNQNSMDYCYSPNTSQYPQSSPQPTNNHSLNNQAQYAVPVNSQQAYGYYQGNSSSAYSNSVSPHSPANNSMCRRYPSAGASQNANVHESSYYNSNYAMQQSYPSSGNNVYKYNSSGSPNVNYSSSSSNSNCSNDEGSVVNSNQPKTNSYAPYQSKAASGKVTECAPAPKSADNSYESASPCGTPVKMESSESSFGHNYGMSKSAMQELQPSAASSSSTAASCVTTKATAAVAPQAGCVTPTDSPKPYQPNCHAIPTSPVQVTNCVSHSPSASATYANAPTHPNSAYQQKMLKHSGQYGQYANSPNESYRGSEGPPPQPNPLLYMGQQQSKYPGASVSKDIPINHPSPHPSLMSKPSAYANSYPAMQNKDQYAISMYHKDVYNNVNNKVAKGWGPSSAHSYQSPDASSTISKQNNLPEKKSASEQPLVPFASAESPPAINRKQPVPLVTNANSHFVSSSKMQHSIPPHCYLPNLKKPLEFPPGSVEAVKPVYRKRRRYCAKRVSPLDPWRLMLALKSGLLVESTWALDALSVLLCDNSSAVYFRLSHLPGLLSVLVEYYRRFLNKIFGLFEDLEVNAGSSNKKITSGSKTKNSSKQKEGKKSSFFNWHKKFKVLDSPSYTFKTRCRKPVNIRYDEALFLIDPEQKWDMYEGFHINSNHWLAGYGEITDHIQIPFETISGKVRFARDMDKEQKGNDDDQTYSSRKFQSSPLSCFGEPIVVLKKCKVFSKSLKGEEKMPSDTENSRTSVENEGEDSLSKAPPADLKPTPISSEQKVFLDFRGINLQSPQNNSVAGKRKSDTIEANPSQDEKVLSSEELGISNESASKRVKEESAKNNPDGNREEDNAFPRLRCPTPQKRVQTDELEDEAYCLDHPSLNLMTDYQEALIRRCMCVSNILRNLSFVPGNDLEMNKNYCLLLVMGRLLLLHHEHKAVKPSHRKYDKEIDTNSTAEDSCVSLRDDNEWWGNLLHVLHDNTFVIFSNIAGQLDLTPFPEEISLPILDGLLHWVTCPSSYARDPLPVKPSLSVLTPQRLALETLCKLSVLDNNVDLMVATPPWVRIEHLFELLVRSLGPVEDKVVKEFAIVLLSSLSQADSSVARTIASQNQCISYLIGFIEQAEAAAFQIASTQGAKKLKDNPEIVGTTPNMVLRVASILKNLALVPENRSAFFRHQQRLLTLATSQIIDQELAVIIAEVLFYCSGDDDDEILPAQFLHS